MGKIKIYGGLMCLCLALAACENKKEHAETNTAPSVSGSASQSEAPALETTVISFQDSAYAFGKINEGDVVEHTFTYTNTGDHPLVITSANASCGCTASEWSKDAILPGKDGKIKVTFNSAGKGGLINKTVSVMANTKPEQKVLKITGEVIKKEETGNGPVKTN
jgi:hypothetical protein